MKKTIIPALFFACCAPAAGFAHSAYPLAVKAEKGNGADFMHALRTGKTAQLKNITATERTALEFLYRYMPLADVTDYSPEFFLDNVRTSFMAQKEMPWGGEVPELLFRHFVLSIRVNNENLDDSRMVFYKELKDRVKGMAMKGAINRGNCSLVSTVYSRKSSSEYLISVRLSQ